MTDRMNHVIEAYIHKYNQKGYVHFDNTTIIRNVSLIVVPLMQNILTKYSESDFHRKMNGIYTDEYGHRAYGFDFIGDWKKNHPFAFNIAMGFARSYKTRLRFDVTIATELIVDIMRSWGWSIRSNEVSGIKHLLWRMRKLIDAA